jgi:hypothetical protein
MSTVTFAGTLAVTNIAGPGTLSAGQSFALFNATTNLGNFSAFDLPQLPYGLGWNWSPTTGTLSVVASPVPVISSFGPLKAGSIPLTFGGEDGHAYSVLTSTNLLLPLTNWTVLSAGTFGTNAVVLPVTPTNKLQYFEIESH